MYVVLKRTFLGGNLNKAFTLAEILITLGIIGVVAAITMPALITNYQKQVTVSQLKKSYSVLNQALQKSIQENGDLSNWESIDGEPEVKYLLPYLKVVDFKKDRWNIRKTGYEIMKSNGDGTSQFWTSGLSKGPYMLSDGTILIFMNFLNYSPMYNALYILVDLNGFKGPNRIGRDIFVFTLSKAKPNIISSSGDNKTVDEILKGKNLCAAKGEISGYQGYVGMGCSTIIIKDGWKIEKHYPWW
mgnify:CR=1 FL=1